MPRGPSPINLCVLGLEAAFPMPAGGIKYLICIKNNVKTCAFHPGHDPSGTFPSRDCALAGQNGISGLGETTVYQDTERQ